MKSFDDLAHEDRKRRFKKAWAHFKNEFWFNLWRSFVFIAVVIFGVAIIYNVIFYFIADEMPFKGMFWLNNLLGVTINALLATVVILTSEAWEIYKNDDYQD